MNREILFRGKRITTKNWAYGFFLGPDSLLSEYYDQSTGSYDLDEFSIDPRTLGQYTGLTDKNGKKIFEGDVVNHQNERIGVVWFDSAVGAWAFGRKPIQEESWYFFDCGGDHNPSDFEILWSIHDNPELIND